MMRKPNLSVIFFSSINFTVKYIILSEIFIQIQLLNFPSVSSVGTFDSLNEIFFRAYSDKRNPDNFHKIKPGDTNSLKNSGLKYNQRLTLIVHVFLEDIAITNSPSQALKNAYLQSGDENIIIAQWIRISNRPILTPEALLLYNSVVLRDAPKVGQIIAEFVAFLVNGGFYGGDNIHLIGLSLGAHIAGSAGHRLQNRFSIKIDRITGLDPPGALFYFISKPEKLDPSDAKYVDVYHTDILYLGTREQLGHVDYYSNGGRRENQPGCRSGVMHPKYLDLVFCGHTSSVAIYAQSLTKDFSACKCSESTGILSPSPCEKPKTGTCALVGNLGKSSNARGSYYLST